MKKMHSSRPSTRFSVLGTPLNPLLNQPSYSMGSLGARETLASSPNRRYLMFSRLSKKDTPQRLC